MIRRHQRLMRNGWCIPHLMEWLFWPHGFQVPDALSRPRGVITENVVGEIIQESLRRRLKVTNRDAGMGELRRLGAIRQEDVKA